MDDPSLETILQISLEEAVTRGEHLLGKAREGAPLTAEQLALQLNCKRPSSLCLMLGSRGVSNAPLMKMHR